MEKQKTAVEWLEDYIQKEINKHSYAPMNIEAIHALNHIKDFACNQAKQMEKEQKITFAEECIHRNDCFFIVSQYYESKYGKDENSNN